MITSDKYRFAFIHIPKCAGSYIKTNLSVYDDTNGFFSEKIEKHSEVGFLDYAHIPLFMIKEHFPEEFEKINNYWSFSIVRDPYKRFSSSISQRLKRYGDMSIEELSNKELRNSVDEVINYLQKNKENNFMLPPEFIHFQKQVDYIFLDRKRIVDTVVPIQNLDLLQREFYLRTGEEIEFSSIGRKVNRQIPLMRNNLLRKIIELTRPVTNLVTMNMSEKTKDWIRSFVYVSRDKRFNDVFESVYVKNFIEDYYKEDIDLLEEIKTSLINKY